MSYEYTLTSDDVARGPPGAVSPLEVSFTSDGKRLAYLYPDASGIRQIHTLTLPLTNEDVTIVTLDSANKSLDSLPLEERLRRERMRLFTIGVTSYQWNYSLVLTTRILIPLSDQIILYNLLTTEVSIIYDGSLGHPMDPQLSSDGLRVGLVINRDLYVIYIDEVVISTGYGEHVIKRLTFEGDKEGVSCGLPDYLAQEEMDRYRGFWWSPDSQYISYTRVDDSNIPEYIVSYPGDEDPHRVEKHRYPFAGKSNPIVHLYIVTVPTRPFAFKEELVKSSNRYIDLTTDAIGADSYIGRVGWWPDNTIMIQNQNRDQNILELLRVDPETLQKSILITEKSSSWLNLHNLLNSFLLTDLTTNQLTNFTNLLTNYLSNQPTNEQTNYLTTNLTNYLSTDPTNRSFVFIYGSERNGFMQLYLYIYIPNYQAVYLPVIPIDDWVVDSLLDVDFDRMFIYVSGNKTRVTEKHLYRIYIGTDVISDSNRVVQLTSEPGWHNCTVSAKAGYYIDTYSSLTQAPITRLYALTNDLTNYISNPLKTLTDGAAYSPEKYNRLASSLVVPIIGSVRSRDDSTDIYYSLQLPANASKPLPVIVNAYGGPHVQRVTNQWLTRVDLRSQLLTQQGYAVIRIDNRGSSNRGLAFESALFKHMGEIEVDDQAIVIERLANEGLIDINRVGIYGWSYGGYLSLMALVKAPHIFKCAVSGAPVTSWDGYDTHYTERYMSLPQKNIDGYTDSSVMTHVSNLTGKLLLVHGLIDENVHFRHTARLIQSLIKQKKSYDLLIFPSERHSPQGLQDRIFMENEIVKYFNIHIPLNSKVDEKIDADIKQLSHL